jgi:hypothetical protein
LLAVLELQRYDSVLAILPFRLLSYAESLAYFGVNLKLCCGWFVIAMLRSGGH